MHVLELSPIKESLRTCVNLLALNGWYSPLLLRARMHSCEVKIIFKNTLTEHGIAYRCNNTTMYLKPNSLNNVDAIKCDQQSHEE